MSHSLAALAAALALSHPGPQDAAPAPPAEIQEPTAQLEDVIVDGSGLEALALEFIESVSAPPRRRGLARWDLELCIGVVNFRAEAAHAIVDRISDMARELEIPLGEPGCAPNAVIVGADDGRALATALVGERRRAFRFGYTRSNRGSRALRAFQDSEAPVRWWHISFPVDAETGELAIRLPGQPAPPLPGSGRRSMQRVLMSDRLARAVIIVDVGRASEISFSQLCDYLALITLAQVDPDGDHGALDTVLNVFDNPASVEGLTEWDRGWLRTLYESGPNRRDAVFQAEAMAAQLTARRTETPAPPE